MLMKSILAGAMTVAVPALAQTAPQTAAPRGDAATTSGAPAGALQDVPETGATTEAAPATQPATPTQIAQLVDQEFPKYAAGGETLTQAQFGAWMTELRSASEPSVTAESPEMKSWVGQAFAQADTDKSKSVSRTELKQFLTASA